MRWELSLGCSLLLLPACRFSRAGERRGPRDGDQEIKTKRWELREEDQEKGAKRWRPRDGEKRQGPRDGDQATESKASGAAHSKVSCPITPFILLPLITQSTGENTCTCPAKSHF